MYYWPVKKNPNTWCLKYNFTTSVAASTETNFDSGKLIFGTLSSDDSVPTDLPALTTSDSDGVPTDLPTLSGVSQGSPDDFPTLPGVPVPPSHNSEPTSSAGSVLSAEQSTSGPTPTISPTFGIPPGGGFGLPPRALPQPPITKSAALPEFSAHELRARTFLPLNGTEVYALAPDGKHTFTSPSIYVVISTISARDRCGKLGNAYTSLTLSFDAGQLSTVDGVTDKTAVFNFADLPCPPRDWVQDNTVPNPLIGNSAMQSEMAKSYHPRILVPKQSLQNLDSTWARSSCVVEDVGQGYDPPRALVPATALAVQSSSSMDPRTSATAEPKSQAQDPAPTQTYQIYEAPMMHTTVPALTPEAHSSVSGFESQQTKTPEHPIGVSTTQLAPDPSPSVASQHPADPTAPVDPPSQPSDPIPADSPAPSQGFSVVLNDHSQPVVLTFTTPEVAPVLSAVVVGGQTLANGGQPVHVNSNTEVPDPQVAPVTVGADPAPTPQQPVPAASPLTIGGLTLTPASPSKPITQGAGDSPFKQSPAARPGVVPGASSIPPALVSSPKAVAPDESPPKPVVIGGLTMTPQAAPSQSPNQAQPGSTPVVAAGVTLTPVANPNSGLGSSSNGKEAPFNVGGLNSAIAQPAITPEVQAGHTLLPVAAGLPPAQASVGGNPVVLGPSHAVIGGTTVKQGAVPKVIANTPVSLGSSALLVGSNTLPIERPQPQPTTVATIGGQAIVVHPSGGINVGGSTVLAGSKATIAGTIVSAQQNGGVVVGSSTISPAIAQAVPATVASVGGQPVVLNPSGGVSIEGSTIFPGSKATIAGTVITAPRSGGAVVASSTIPPPAAQPLSFAPAPVFSVGGSTFVGNPSSIQIGNTVLSKGGPGITIGSTPISLGAGGLAIGSKTIPPASLNGVRPTSGSTPAFVVGGQTLSIGGPGVNVRGTSLSLASDGIVVGGSTLSVPSALALPTLAGQQIQTQSGGNIVIHGSTLQAGGAPATIDGSTLSALPSGRGVVVNGRSTVSIPRPPTVAGQQIATAADGAIIIGSETLSRGAQATVSGTKVSVLQSGGIVLGGSTIPFSSFPTLAPDQHPSIFSIDGTALTSGSAPITVHGTVLSLGSDGVHVGSSVVPYASIADLPGASPSITGPQVFSIANTAVTAGGPAITISGTRVSLGTSGLLVVGSSTMQIPTTPPSYGTKNQITAAPSAGYVIGGKTLRIGQAITISGTVLSLGPSSELVVGGTRTLDLASTAQPSIFDVAGQVFTAAVGGFKIDGTSIYPGQAVTISNTPVSLNPVGIVIGTRTYSLPLPAGSTFAVDGQTLTANSFGYSVGGAELSLGGKVTINGTPLSLATTGAVVVGTDTVPLASMTTLSSPIFTVDGQIFTKNRGGYSVDGTELPSSGAVTVSGHTISAEGTAIVVDSSTVPLSNITALATSSLAAVPTDSAGNNVSPVPNLMPLCITVLAMAAVAIGIL